MTAKVKRFGVRVHFVAKSMVKRYFEDRVARSSAELSYYMLFSLFPFIIFFNSVISSFDLSSLDIAEKLSLILPEPVVAMITDYITYTASLRSETLLYAGFFLTLYVTTRAVSSLMLSVGRAYRVTRRPTSNFFISVAIAVVLLVSIYLILALILISEELFTMLAGVLSLPLFFVKVWNLLRFAAAPAYLLLITTIFYKIIPIKKVRFRNALPGGLFFVVSWAVISSLFSFYVANMANYSVLYGSLGAIMILMLWFYITGVILILGGHLNNILTTAQTKKEW